jgi:hypothetical protein
MCFPYHDEEFYDMEDELSGLHCRNRNHIIDFERKGEKYIPTKEEETICSLENRHLFVHGSKGGHKIEDSGKEGTQLLLPAIKKVNGKDVDKLTGEILDIDGKVVVPAKKEDEETKVEPPKEVLIDLNDKKKGA